MKNKSFVKQKLATPEDDLLTLAPPIETPHFEIVADEEDTCVYIRIDGFNVFDDCVDYANWLATYLPLLLYKTEVVH